MYRHGELDYPASPPRLHNQAQLCLFPKNGAPFTLCCRNWLGSGLPTLGGMQDGLMIFWRADLKRDPSIPQDESILLPEPQHGAGVCPETPLPSDPPRCWVWRHPGDLLKYRFLSLDPEIPNEWIWRGVQEHEFLNNLAWGILRNSQEHRNH